MKIVFDLGCYTHPGYEDESLGPLIEKYDPDLYIGYDPLVEDKLWRQGGTICWTHNAIAWTYDGFFGYKYVADRPLRSHVIEGEDTVCVDIGRVVSEFPPGHFVIVKMDIEGSEYVLIEDWLERNILNKVSLLLVEWHGPDLSHKVTCPYEEWR